MEVLKQYFKQLKDGIKTMFKEFFNKDTNKKQRANMWTFSRIVITPFVLLFMLLGLPILSCVSVALGGITDYFDGKSARKHGSTSDFGKFLDQIADKFFSIVMGISLTIINPMFLISLIGESIISSTNIYYKFKYKDITINSSVMGKIKQWPLSLSFVLGFLSIVFPQLIVVTNCMIFATSIFQAATWATYVEDNQKEIRRKKMINISEEIKEAKEKEEVKELSKLNEKSNLKDKYIELRDALNKIIDIKNLGSIDETMTNSNQKIKK